MSGSIGWRARLLGSEDTLRELLKFADESNFNLTEDSGGIYLHLPDIPETTNAGNVKKKVEEYVSILNGSIKLLAGVASALVNEGIEWVQPDGSKKIFMFVTGGLSIKCTATMAVLSSDGSIVEPPSKYVDVPDLFSLALGHEKLRTVLELWCREEQDWVNLYRIFEIIKCDSARNFGKLGPSMRELELFGHTANSPAAIGMEARHGVSRGSPPENPMSLERAHDLIDHLIKGWVRSLQQ